MGSAFQASTTRVTPNKQDPKKKEILEITNFIENNDYAEPRVAREKKPDVIVRKTTKGFSAQRSKSS